MSFNFHLPSKKDELLYMSSVVGKSEFYFRFYFYFRLLFILFACMSGLFNFFLPVVFLITCHYSPVLVLLLAYEGCTTITGIIDHLMAM